jgi:polyhydroxybutyrate depolymerase
MNHVYRQSRRPKLSADQSGFMSAAAMLKIVAGAVLLALLAVVLYRLSSNHSVSDQQISVKVKGQERTCFIHMPPQNGHSQLLPLVIAFHGSHGTGRAMAASTNLNALADEKGFIAACPDGILGNWNCLLGEASGDFGRLLAKHDDVAFTRALIDLLCNSFNADPDRVFVFGHSSGAHMCYRLALELPDKIAAAGIVEGAISILSVDGKPVTTEIPKPRGMVSLMQICGGKDDRMSFNGRQTPKSKILPVLDSLQLFLTANGCADTPKKTDDSDGGVHRTLYSDCKAGTAVELVILDNCPHIWPGDGYGLATSRALWEFFLSHPKNREAR